MTQAPPGDFPPLEVSLPSFEAIPAFRLLLEYPPIKALIPVLVILAIAPPVYWLFGKTWKQLDAEARAHARQSDARDFRPAVCLVTVALTLTLQEYYGGRHFFETTLRPVLSDLQHEGSRVIQLDTYAGLYGFAWWSLARIIGYVFVPLVVWKIAFPRDSILDMGLRVRGFFSHLWLYVLCLAVVFGAMTVVAKQPDFLTYYPFYKTASRSWFDLLAWEGLYFLQFLALEFYFRGWMLEALRKTTGATAIFIMAVPYCMIHYGKPYLEAHGAIVAGVVLGSLSMRTRSIYAGFLVHITVAGLMDYFALASRDALPEVFWPR